MTIEEIKETVEDLKRYRGPINVVAVPYLTERKQQRWPEFRDYGWLRKIKLFRKIRAWYKRRTWVAWQQDEDNFKQVPMETFYLKDSTIFCHPEMAVSLRKHIPKETPDEFGLPVGWQFGNDMRLRDSAMKSIYNMTNKLL